jgi:hypothetical protein
LYRTEWKLITVPKTSTGYDLTLIQVFLQLLTSLLLLTSLAGVAGVSDVSVASAVAADSAVGVP